MYNGPGGHQVKTGKVMDNTINPEFWTSFELSAMLPGQASGDIGRYGEI